MENWLWKSNLALFDTYQKFSKVNNFLCVCWFLDKTISNSVPLPWKLNKPYYHIEHLGWIKLKNIKTGWFLHSSVCGQKVSVKEGGKGIFYLDFNKKVITYRWLMIFSFLPNTNLMITFIWHCFFLIPRLWYTLYTCVKTKKWKVYTKVAEFKETITKKFTT